jgi:hypothetical protein
MHKAHLVGFRFKHLEVIRRDISKHRFEFAVRPRPRRRLVRRSAGTRYPSLTICFVWIYA